MPNLEDLGGGYFKEEGTSGPGQYYGSRTAAENAMRGGGGDFISSMGFTGFIALGVIVMFVMLWKICVALVVGCVAGMVVHAALSRKISVFPYDFAEKIRAAAPNQLVRIFFLFIRKILRGIESIILGLPALIIVLSVLNVAFPDKWDTQRQHQARHETEMNASAKTYTLSVAPENGYPVKISRISYRSDATIVTIADVKDGATAVFFDTSAPENRYIDYTHEFGGKFTVTAASGEYESTKVRAWYDKEKKKYIGVEVLFPPEFTDPGFTMTEISQVSRGAPNYYQGVIENPLVFNNVTVQK